MIITPKGTKVLQTFPGLIDKMAFERTDTNGNLVVMTLAIWNDEQALRKAKETAQAEYKRLGLNATAMFERLNITVERATFSQISLQE
jgi:hypothetical protein